MSELLNINDGQTWYPGKELADGHDKIHNAAIEAAARHCEERFPLCTCQTDSGVCEGRCDRSVAKQLAYGIRKELKK